MGSFISVEPPALKTCVIKVQSSKNGAFSAKITLDKFSKSGDKIFDSQAFKIGF